jgi:hypothetical protein
LAVALEAAIHSLVAVEALVAVARQEIGNVIQAY